MGAPSERLSGKGFWRRGGGFPPGEVVDEKRQDQIEHDRQEYHADRESAALSGVGREACDHQDSSRNVYERVLSHIRMVCFFIAYVNNGVGRRWPQQNAGWPHWGVDGTGGGSLHFSRTGSTGAKRQKRNPA